MHPRRPRFHLVEPFLLVAVCVASLAGTNRAGAQEHSPTVIFGGEESYPSLNIRGFSDIVYVTSDHPTDDNGFELGQFVLHLTSALAKKTAYFGELSATPRKDEFRFEVERSFIRYDYNDAFKISFGRYHTPIGYWNTAFHHGLWLQTTVRRPEQIRFGGELVPVHFIGVIAEGRIPSGTAGLGYAAGLGNGRSEILSRAGDAGDPNSNRAWLVQLTARPIVPFGFEAGTSIYRDKLELSNGPSFGEWIGSAHMVWTGESPELLSEYVVVRHEDKVTGTHYDSRAFYVQAAYRLPGEAQFAKPYARYEKIDVASGEPIFSFPDIQVVTAGIRFDVIALAAFKAEYRNELRDGFGRVNTMLLQTSFTF